jgi:hypothetical protein
MKNKKLKSSSEFYKELRPEYFSDSKEEQEVLLPKATLAHELSTLSTNMKQDDFENLARKMAEKLISPNLIPQTWPNWWWDWKTDSESYPVSELISDRWFSSDESLWKKWEKWAFAMSTTVGRKSKVKSDVKKIVWTKRWYNKIYFITNQIFPNKDRKKVEDELIKEYGIEVIIFNWDWIIERIYSNNLINLTVNTLNLSSTYKTKKILWKNDISRQQELDRLEENIKNTDRYFDYDYQLVYDALETALLSRMLELPKDEVIWKFDRAKRLNKKLKSKKLEIKISYQLAWTYLMFYDEKELFCDEYKEFKKSLWDENDISDLELNNNLLSLLIWLSVQIDLEKLNIVLDKEKKEFIEKLEIIEKDKTKLSSWLIARTFKVFLSIIDNLKDKKDNDWNLKELIIILKKSETLLDFPFKMLKDLINQIWEFLVDSTVFDKLIDALAETESKRSSDKWWWKIFLERWMQKIEWKKYKEAIIYFWKSVSKLAKEESKYEMYFALLWLAEWYRQLWLYNAYYNCITNALYLKLKIFFEWGELDKSIIKLLGEIIQDEILIWKFPHILMWLEIYVGLSRHSLNFSIQEIDEFLIRIDWLLAVRLLNTSFNEIKKFTFLPDLFKDIDFTISRDSILYLYWKYDSLESLLIEPNSTKEKKDELFKKMSEQPLVKQLEYETNFLEENNSILETNILWCNIKIKSLEDLLLSEQILIYFESFLATATTNIAPKIGKIELNIILWDDFSISEEFNLDKHIYNIILNKDNINCPDTYFNFFINVITKSFIIKDINYFEELFKNNEVLERISIIFNHKVVINNIFWTKIKNHIEDWKNKNYKDFKVLNTSSPIKTIIKKENSDNYDMHNNKKVLSLINMDLWNNAKWNWFGNFLHPIKKFWIVLFFQNKEYAKKIIKEWFDKMWNEDKDNLLRITIIKWIDEKNPYHYRVSISSNFKKDIENDWFFQIISRHHTMTPNSPQNLNNLEWMYSSFKEFILHFWFIDLKTWKQELFEEIWIKKKELIIKNACNIKENDPDIVAIKDFKNK